MVHNQSKEKALFVIYSWYDELSPVRLLESDGIQPPNFRQMIITTSYYFANEFYGRMNFNEASRSTSSSELRTQQDRDTSTSYERTTYSSSTLCYQRKCHDSLQLRLLFMPHAFENGTDDKHAYYNFHKRIDYGGDESLRRERLRRRWRS
eukprot:6442012-Amphidinium_carterae.3